MASKIDLKRTAVPFKVPTTSSLNLGELAINTYDGKVYIKKNNGLESIVELVSTTFTGSVSISGSLNLVGNENLTGYLQLNPVTTNINSSISASYIYVSGSTNDLYFTQNNAGYANTTRLRWLEGNLYTGLLHGGVISASIGGTTYQVQSGSGIIVNLNASTAQDPYPIIQFINWPTLTTNIASLSASYDQQFVSINSSAQIFAQGIPYNDGDYNTKIPIGIVIHQNRSTINAAQTFPSVAYGYKQRTYDFIKAFGPLKISGYTLQPSSSLGLLLDGGTAWVDGRNYIVDPSNPSYITEAVGIATSKIYYYHQSGSSFVYNTNNGAGYQNVTSSLYSNNGVLTPLGATSRWSIQRVFYFPNSATKAFYIYFGNAEYSDKDAAIAAISTETFSEAPNTAANAIFVGYMLLRSNANFGDTNTYEFRSAGLFRGISGGSGGSGGGGGGGATTLAGLTDVNISSPTNGQPLVYSTSATKWINSSALTASLQGTASWANNAITASYSPNYLPLTGGTINGNVIINGTASISFLNVTYESASVIYSSGSNQFGDAANDTQTLYGLVVIPTGSLIVTGSITTTQGITGSLHGTSSWAYNTITASYVSGSIFTSTNPVLSASYALTASYALNAGSGTGFPFSGSGDITGSLLISGSGLVVSGSISSTGGFTGSLQGTASYALTSSNVLGGANNYIPLWSGSTVLSSSTIYQNNGNIGIGTISPGVKLHVALGTGSMGINTYETIVAERNGDTKLGVYTSTNTFNPAIGTSVALGYSNLTASSTYYPGFEMQMIGNVTESQNKLRFNYIQRNTAGVVAGGYLELLNIYPDARVTLAPTAVGAVPRLIIGATSSIYNLDVSGSANINNGLTVTGSVIATSFTGSLQGTSSWANNSISASYALTASYALNAGAGSGFPFSGSGVVTGSLLISGSGLTVSGSISSTGGFTGSLQGTSSWANNSVTASYISPTFISASAAAAGFGSGGGSSAGFNVTASFTSSPTWTLTHNLGQKYVIIQAYDSNNNQIIPQTITLVDNNTTTISFNTTESGYAVASIGGGTIISQSIIYEINNTASALFATTGSNIFRGNQIITGSLTTTGGITGSLQGTSSWAYNAITSSYITSSNVYGPYGFNSVLSASYALTASYALNAGSGVGFPFSGSGVITGSLLISGSGLTITGSLNSPNITGSLQGTSSWAYNTITASYISPTFISASAAASGFGSGGGSGTGFPFSGSAVITGSLLISGSGLTITGSLNSPNITGSLQGTASWATNAQTASSLSIGTYNITSSWANNSITASYISPTFISASAAASGFGSGGGSGTGFPFSGSGVITGSLLISGSGLTVTGSILSLGGFTGSLQGTSSWANNAVTASYISPTFISASAAASGFGSGGGSGTGFPFSGSGVITGSLLISGSAVGQGLIISGSLNVTQGITGSLFGTSSWASNVVTASYITSSFFTGNNAALSSSYASNAGQLNGQTFDYYLTASNITAGTLSNSRLPSAINVTSVSASFTGSLTGALIGTASWATNASNYAETDPVYTAEKGKYITTGSAGTTQTISGSLIINQNLTILGTASIQHITSSQLNIGTNLITVNTNFPSIRFGGLAVIDSGSSPLSSGSFLYDSVQDEFIFVHKGNGVNMTSSHFLVGPETYDDLGNEKYISNGVLIKSLGNEHVSSSNITDTGIVVSINSNTKITGSLLITGSLTLTGSLIAPNITGSLQGTATTASYVDAGGITTGTLSNSRLPSAINVTSVSASFTGSLTGALIGTSSWATNAQTASSLPIGTYNITSSWAVNVLTASSANEFTVRNDLYVYGNTTLGDATTDNISFTAATMSIGGGDGILNIDSNTLYVDGFNNRVGIGTSTPNSKLDINNGTINVLLNNNDPALRVTASNAGLTNIEIINLSTSTNAGSALRFANNIGSTGNPQVQMFLGSSNYSVGGNRFFIQSITGSVEITSKTGNVDINTVDSGVSNTKLRIFQNGNVAVGTNPSDTGFEFNINGPSVSGSLRVSGSSVMTGSLTVTQGITASLQGTSSWATNAVTATTALTANNGGVTSVSVAGSGISVSPASGQGAITITNQSNATIGTQIAYSLGISNLF